MNGLKKIEYHANITFSDGSYDMIYFIMSTEDNNTQPIMGPLVTSTANGGVPSYSSYSVIPFYYNPGQWYLVEMKNIDYTNKTYDLYTKQNQMVIEAN